MNINVGIYDRQGIFLEIREFQRVPVVNECIGMCQAPKEVYKVSRVYFPQIGSPRIQLSGPSRIIKLSDSINTFYD